MVSDQHYSCKCLSNANTALGPIKKDKKMKELELHVARAKMESISMVLGKGDKVFYESRGHLKEDGKIVEVHCFKIYMKEENE